MLLHTRDSLKFAFSREEPLESFLSSREPGGEIFGILGIPFDATVTYMPGARFGPSAIREASYNFEKYNLAFNKELKIPVFDLGDVEIAHGDFKETSRRVEDAVNELTGAEITPIILGGEHSISYPVIKAMKSLNDFTVLHFDAHMDMKDHYGGRFTHATVMRRVYELEPMALIQVGVRSAALEELKFADEQKIEYYTAGVITENMDTICKKLGKIRGPVYVTVDVDVLDPSHAPMVGNPTPCGLTPLQMEKFIEVIAEKEVMGLDIVEVASSKRGEQTAINAAKILYDFLCLRS